MALSLTEVIARRRLARVYRRVLLLAVPAVLAGCQDGVDPLSPESVASETVPTDAVASLVAPGRIAFSVLGVDEEDDIWTMSSTGGGMTKLTSFAGPERDAAWSPDHQQIAFQRARNGKLDIQIMNADGTGKHWAVSPAPAYPISSPSWAPDGKSLLVHVWLTASTSKPYVGKIDLASKTWKLLSPAYFFGGLTGWYPTWDKDGKWIYYVDAATHHQIRRFQPNGADKYFEGVAGSVDDLAFSPDGTRLAFTDYFGPGDNKEIVVLDLSTHHYTRLTNDPANDNHPAWSPDGSLIAFASARSGKNQIYTVNSSTGGSLQKITSKPNGAAYPAWYR